MADFQLCEHCDTILEAGERCCPSCGRPAPAFGPAPRSAAPPANIPSGPPSRPTVMPGGGAGAPAATKARRLGHYRLVKQVGRGAMGVVYLAYDEDLGREVALKVLPPLASSDPKVARRFEREAQAAAALDHPGIVKVYGAGEHRGLRYYAMTYVEGITLSEFIHQHEYDVEHAATLGYYLADALAYAHECGVIHRDIKPDNILLRDSDGMPVITDFGLARRLDDVRLTATGATVGTPAYMSPEQVRGRRDLTGATDQFSLGAVLYELFSGKMAFPGEVMQEVMESIVYRDPIPLRKQESALPVELGVIVEKTLEKEPRHRYESLRELADDLSRFIEGEPIEARPLSPLQKTRRWVRKHSRLLAITGALVAVALIVVGVVWQQASVKTAEARRNREVAERRATKSTLAARRSADKLREEREHAKEAGRQRAKLQAARREARRLLTEVRYIVEYNTNLSIVEETRPYIAKALNIAPDLSDAKFLLGRLEHRTFHYAKAVQAYTQAVQLDPSLHRARFYLGLLQFDLYPRQEAFKHARAAFLELAMNSETQATAFGLLARAYVALADENYDHARKLAARATSENALFSEGFYLSAALRSYLMVGASGDRVTMPLGSKNLRQAEKDLDRCLDLEPVHLNARILRGILRRERRDNVAALADFQEAARIAPRSSRPLFWRGIARYEAGETALARADFEKAIEVAPGRAARLYRFRGLLSFSERKWRTALADFEKSIEIRGVNKDNRGSLDYAFMAMCRINMDKPQQAAQDWERVFSNEDMGAARGRLRQVLKLPFINERLLAPVLKANRVWELPPAEKQNLRTLYGFQSFFPKMGGMALIARTRDVEDLEYQRLLIRLSDKEDSPVPKSLAKLDPVCRQSIPPRMFLGFLAWTNLTDSSKVLEQQEELPHPDEYYQRAVIRYLEKRDSAALRDMEVYSRARPENPRGALAMATLLSMAGETDGAFLMLREAKRLGAPMPDIQADSDFKALRGDPRCEQFPAEK